MPPDPEGPEHWIEGLIVVQVADIAMEHALEYRQQLSEAIQRDTRSGGMDAGNKAPMLRQVVAGFCPTPPTVASTVAAAEA